MPHAVPADYTPVEPPLGDAPRRLLASAAMIGSITVLAKLIAFAKDWMVARRYGASDEVDAFLVAFLIPAYAVAVVAQSFSAAFLPSYIRVQSREGSAAASMLAGRVLGAGLIILVAVTVLLAAVTRFILPWLGAGFDAEKLLLTGSLFHVLLAVLVLSGISSIYAAVLNAHEQFTVTAFAPMAVPIVNVIVFGLLQERFGIFALAYGMVLGFALEACVLGWGLHRRGLPWRPQWPSVDERLRNVGTQYSHLVAGAFIMCSSTLVDQSMAASLGSGNVSILNYSNKIVALVLNIVAVSLVTVLFPRFSRLIAAGDWGQLRKTLRSTTWGVLLASIPGVAILALLSEPMIRLLFERGAFTPETTADVSRVQNFLLPQIPFYVLAYVGGRLLSALDANRLVLAIAGLNLAFNVAGNYVFMQWFGVRGIAISTSLMYFIASLATYAAIRWKLGEVARP